MTLTEALKTQKSLTGHEIEKISQKFLSDPSTEGVVARQIHSNYFSTNSSEFKPTKFGYYKLIRKRDKVVLKRDFNMSPLAKDYFNKDIKTLDPLRAVIVNRSSMCGRDLKSAIIEIAGYEYSYPDKGLGLDTVTSIQCFNYTIQLAKHLKEYFVTSEKPIKDEVYYTIDCKEYGTATVYRDLKRSPRTTENN